MVDVSVCVEMVFDDEPFHERIHRAAATGADAVEFWGWREKDLAAVQAAADESNVPIAAVSAGGTLTDPGQADDTIETIRDSIETAADLGCTALIATTGPEQDGIDRATQHENIVEILSAVAPDAAEAGVTLALEPLNVEVDHHGYYLTSSDEGFEIIEAVDSQNVRLLYDVYHQQITEGNVIQTVTENVDLIGHVHVAGVPGRHEPGTGELNYRSIFKALDDAGYGGYVGCEFEPTGDPESAMAAVLDVS